MNINKIKAGLKVVYKPQGGKEEKGTIAYYNGHYVFVRYGNSMNCKATRPEDLEVEVI